MKLLGFVVILAICASNIAFEHEQFDTDYEIDYSDEEYGFRELWDKVKAAAKKLGPQIKSDAVSVLKKFKPKILDSLKKVGKVVIEAGKHWVIEVRDGIVRVLADGKEGKSGEGNFEGEGSPIYVVYNSPNSKVGDKIKEIWAKVKAAVAKLKFSELVKKYGEKIIAKIDAILDRYKDIIIKSLKESGKVVIEQGRIIVIEIIKDVAQVIVDGIHAVGGKNDIVELDEEDNGIKEIWEKVVAAVKAYTGRFKGDVEKMVAKYKPRIIEELKKFKTVVIDEGKQLVIDMLGDAIKIIIRGGIGYEEELAENGITDIWAKIVATIKKLPGVVMENAIKVLAKYKVQIQHIITDIQNLVIAAGKDLVIQIKDAVIKIITDGFTAVSDGSSGAEFFYEDDYVMVIFPETDVVQGYGLKDTWAKVKDAFKRLGEKIKAKSEDLWKKIVPVAGPVIEKYKALIIKALENNGKVIINEGKKIVITVINDVVKVVIDGIDAVSHKIGYEDEDEVENAIFDELWGKVKIAAKKLGDQIKVDVVTVLDEYKPKIVEALKSVGRVVIEAGKEWVIEVRDGIVKVISEAGNEATSEGESFELETPVTVVFNSPNSKAGDKIKEIWGKVKAAFQNLGEKIKAAAKRFAEKMAGLGEKIKGDTAEVRAKIAKAVKKYADKILASLNAILDKYKDIIIDALTKDGKVIIDEGRTIIIEVVNDVVKVIVDGLHALGGKSQLSSDEEDDEENGIKEIWEKVVAAVKAYTGKFKEDLQKMVVKYKPRIIEELKKFKTVVIDEGKQLVIDMLGDAIKIIIRGGIGYEEDEAENGVKEIWEKVKAAVKAYTGKFKEDLEKMVAKYKPRIIEELKKFKTVVIDEGKQLLIDMLGDAIKIIIRGGIGYEEVEEFSFVDIWAKVKATVAKMKGVVKEVTMKTLEKYKPKIMAAVKDLKDVVIQCGKDVVIQVKHGVIKVITEGGVAFSEDVDDFEWELAPVIIVYEDAESYGLKDTWAKVKDAFKRLGEKIKAKSEDLWKKIVPVAGPVIEKYKDLIIKALEHNGKVIIDEGKKIVITVIDDVVKVVIDGMDALSHKIGYEDEVDNGFIKDLIWAKVKTAAAKLSEKIKVDVVKILNEYKPKIIKALMGVGDIVIQAGKEWVIEIKKGVIKVIAETGEEGTSEGETYLTEVSYSKAGDKIKEIWAKVKAAFQSLGEKIKAAAKRFAEKVAGLGEKIKGDTAEIRAKIAKAVKKYADKILASLNAILDKYKDIIIDALTKDGKVIIDEGRTIIIEVVGDVVKVIVDGLKALGGKSQLAAYEENGLKEIWEKVVAAMKDYTGKYKEDMQKLVTKYKPRIIEELKKFKTVVIEEGKGLLIDMLGDAIKIIVRGGIGYEEEDEEENGVKEIWEKVKAAVKAYTGKFKEDLEKMVAKYKPRIIEELKKFKTVVIDEGKQLLIDMLGDAIKIIIRGGIGYEEVEEFSFVDIWGKIKATAAKMKGVFREVTMKTLEKYKPKIMAAVKDLKDVVIQCGKDLVIQVKDGVIKIITEGGVAFSEDTDNFEWEATPLIIVYENPESNGIKDSWKKVQDAFKKLGEQIKAKSIDLWNKIVPIARPVIEKYKDIIIKALIHDGKIVIDEGRKIVITVIEDVVKVIIDGMDALSGKKPTPATNLEENLDWKSIWDKVKAAVTSQSGRYTKEIKALIEKYKPRILDQLKKVKKVIIEEGKTLVIEMLGDTIKIIIKGGISDETTEVDELRQDNANFAGIWEKVKKAAAKIPGVFKDATDKIIKKYKPKVIKELNKVGEIVIEAGKKILIKVKDNIVEIFVDGILVGKSS